jgi:hypothetical protein
MTRLEITDASLHEKALDFLAELMWAVQDIPSEMARQWREANSISYASRSKYDTPWLLVWDRHPCPVGCTPGNAIDPESEGVPSPCRVCKGTAFISQQGRPIIVVDSEADRSRQDYKLWVALGWIIPAVFALIILGVLSLIAGAAGVL